MSLIIVLGLLALLTGLAASFALIMRSERAAGRGMLDQTRARHLIPVALNLALDDIQNTMVAYRHDKGETALLYPDWSDYGWPDALASTNLVAWAGSAMANPIGTLLGGTASNAIPRSLRTDATGAVSRAQWIPVPHGGTNPPLGRVAYLIVNVSGLHDANALRNLQRGVHYWAESPVAWDDVWLGSSNIVDGLYWEGEIDEPDDFFWEEGFHYETLPELLKHNPAFGVIPAASNLFVFSFDPNPDQYFEDADTNLLGTAAMGTHLFDKLNVNSVTNTQSDFVPFTNLVAILEQAGFTNNAEQVAGNLVGYLDRNAAAPDHPDGGPWTDRVVGYGGQAVPLINEVAWQATSGAHEFVTELWFPFHPPSTNTYEFRLHVFTNANAPGSLANAAWSATNTIEAMDFESNPFVCFTNNTGISTTNHPTVRYWGQVLRQPGNMLVNEAMRGEIAIGPTNRYYSAIDPRANRRKEDWQAMATKTLGRINDNFPWTNSGARLPLFQRGGPMRSIAELRHIYAGPEWRHIDLLDPDQGGFLMDRLSVGLNIPSYGRIHIGTCQDVSLRVLFHKAEKGFKNTVVSTNRALDVGFDWEDIDDILLWADRQARNYRELLAASTNFPHFAVVAHTNRMLTADLFDEIPERLTFRQNVFLVILKAEALAPPRPSASFGLPLATKRAYAIVIRDAYTGRAHIRRVAGLP